MKKNNDVSDITLRKYIDVAKNMREKNNYNLDISKYNTAEIYAITILATNDTLFKWLQTVQDVDLETLQAVIEYILAERKLKKQLSLSKS